MRGSPPGYRTRCRLRSPATPDGSAGSCTRFPPVRYRDLQTVETNSLPIVRVSPRYPPRRVSRHSRLGDGTPRHPRLFSAATNGYSGGRQVNTSPMWWRDSNPQLVSLVVIFRRRHLPRGLLPSHHTPGSYLRSGLPAQAPRVAVAALSEAAGNCPRYTLALFSCAVSVPLTQKWISSLNSCPPPPLSCPCWLDCRC